ncbi:hypothetical protein B0J18DRAFT_291580 [Chaetomium sp. MPI-SDFR-AT-0129]|nr:hypothetical protein B0J18DRAFT_291580 [Chaetomium sp. MPI-SDFR-AT-0129]
MKEVEVTLSADTLLLLACLSTFVHPACHGDDTDSCSSTLALNTFVIHSEFTLLIFFTYLLPRNKTDQNFTELLSNIEPFSQQTFKCDFIQLTPPPDYVTAFPKLATFSPHTHTDTHTFC